MQGNYIRFGALIPDPFGALIPDPIDAGPIENTNGALNSGLDDLGVDPARRARGIGSHSRRGIDAYDAEPALISAATMTESTAGRYYTPGLLPDG